MGRESHEITIGPAKAGTGWRRALVPLLACVVAFAGRGIAEAQGRGQGPERPSALARPDAPVDLELGTRLSRASDADVQRVIVRMKPGAKGKLMSELRGRGARLGRDFRSLEAFSGEVTARTVRELRKHPDVLSMSIDAEVRSAGITSDVVGSPLNSAYSLRSTLGLDVPGEAVTQTWRRGDSWGSTVYDTIIRTDKPGTNYGAAGNQTISSTNGGHLLVRFDSLFGSGSHQIPYGSTIVSASLTFAQANNSTLTTATARAHRMRVSWSESSTASSLTTSGTGIQRDGVEASSTADASVTGLGGSVSLRVLTGSDLVASLQAWANGEPNFGWALWQSSSTGLTIYASDTATAANRPMLSVTYRPPSGRRDQRDSVAPVSV